MRGLLPVVIVILSVVAFLPGPEGELLTWEDDVSFLANESYRGLADPVAFSNAWMGHYIPLTWLNRSGNYVADGMAADPRLARLGDLVALGARGGSPLRALRQQSRSAVHQHG